MLCGPRYTVFAHHADSQSTVEVMSTAGVEFASATPSYWRRLLTFSKEDVLKQIPLVQITIGGEVVDQPLLDNLKRHFPNARLVHIYATTELGRCFSVTDGLAGFPVDYLDQALPDGVELSVNGGELFVRSPNSMRRYDGHSSQQGSVSGPCATGDLVEVQGNRVYFVGRKTDVINVAGSKVHPVEVERVIRGVPGVLDVRVFGKSSSIAGQVVACEVVPAHDKDPETLKVAITRTCMFYLSTPQRPRSIKFVGQMNLTCRKDT